MLIAVSTQQGGARGLHRGTAALLHRYALDQIESKGYAERYATDGRRIVKVGMGFSVEKRAMTEYIIS